MTHSTDADADFDLHALLAEAGWVQALARRLARDQADAEDVSQGAMLLALERRPAARDGLRPWLARVVSRLTRHHVRAEQRRKAREELIAVQRAAGDVRVTDALESLELQQGLARRVAKLPDPYRALLIRRYYLDQTVGQIATDVGTTAGTVRSQLGRGLDRLRAQYRNEGGDRSPLATFLIAGGSGELLTREAVGLAVMSTTSKKAAVTVLGAALILFTVLLSTGVLDPAASTPKDLEPLAGSDVQLARSSSESPTIAERTPVEGERGSVANDRTPGSASPMPSDVSTIRARVVGMSLQPIAGAALRLVDPDGRPSDGVQVARSDDDGVAELALDDSLMRMWRDEVFDMTFSISARGCATEFRIQRPTLHAVTDLGLVALRKGAEFVGRCVDVHGEPVAGADVLAGLGVVPENLEERRVLGPDLEVARPFARTDKNGRFVLSGIATGKEANRSGRARIWARVHGCLWTVTEPFDLVPGVRTDVGLVVLERAPAELRIEGTVRCPDGRAAAGAVVDFFSRGSPHYGRVEAGDDGHFLVLVRDSTPMELVARDPSRRFGVSASRIVVGGDRVDLTLRVQTALTVEVADMDGTPLVDAHVMPTLAAEPGKPEYVERLLPGQNWIETDAAGRAGLEPPGQMFWIVVRRTGSRERKVGPFWPESVPEMVKVSLERGPEVSGRVLADGVPIANAKVAVMRRYEGFAAMTGGFPNRYPSNPPSVRTDEAGRFRAPLDPKWTQVGVLVRADDFATAEVQLAVRQGASVGDVEVELTKGGALVGAVLPPPGGRITGLHVVASRGDGAPISTLVGEGGNYRFERLTPGPWMVEGRLRAPRTEMRSISQNPQDMHRPASVVVVDGEERRFDVDMRLAGQVTLTGRLQIDGAAPLAGWAVEVLPPKHSRGPDERPTAELDPSGAFVVTAPSGRARLRLVGLLRGGAVVEMVREVHLQGRTFHWDESLSTAVVEETFEAGIERARFVRVAKNGADGESTSVSVPSNGMLAARVPIGVSELQVASKGAAGWRRLRSVLVR